MTVQLKLRIPKAWDEALREEAKKYPYTWKRGYYDKKGSRQAVVYDLLERWYHASRKGTIPKKGDEKE